MGDAPDASSVYHVLQALEKNKIRYMIAGMAAAVIQGAPATTLDTDIWVDYPSREYMKIIEICRRLGGDCPAPTVAEFPDGTMINFLYRVDGLNGFSREYVRCVKVRWMGMSVSLLPLSSILKSKTFVGREKDIAHIPLLKQTIRMLKKI